MKRISQHKLLRHRSKSRELLPWDKCYIVQGVRKGTCSKSMRKGDMCIGKTDLPSTISRVALLRELVLL